MNLLSIGGSDPSSGAGIQGDIKTFEAHGAYGLTILTAITAQNTAAFTGAEPVSDSMLSLQIDSIFSDFEISGIKIGMVYTAQSARVLAGRLGGVASEGIPIVVDPVMRSTTGGALIERSALGDYVKHVMPLATAITPNLQEAQALLAATAAAATATPAAPAQGRRVGGRTGSGPRHEETAAELVRATGAKSAVITGIAEGDSIRDVVAAAGRDGTVTASSLDGRRRIGAGGQTHGGGCMFSASLLCGLAGGMTIVQSARAAQEFVIRSMMSPVAGAGAGIPIISTARATDPDRAELEYAIGRLARVKNMHRHIPECQSNFVYAGNNPRSVQDVLGIRGRMVRTGKTVTVAGSIEYGGSKHVATAVIAACGRFPQIRSAVNIRYDRSTINAMGELGMNVLEYDRGLEPSSTKSAGSSIRWGVLESTGRSALPPDAIFHRGDHGKEPMIIVFGTTPEDVLSKVARTVECAGTARGDGAR